MEIRAELNEGLLLISFPPLFFFLLSKNIFYDSVNKRHQYTVYALIYFLLDIVQKFAVGKIL